MSQDLIKDIRKKLRAEAIIKAIASNKAKAIIGLSLFVTISLIIAGIFTGFFVDISKVTAASVTVVAFETNGNGLAGNEATFDATTNDANLNISTLSRGAGIAPNAVPNTFSSDIFVINGLKADAISNAEYLQLAIGAKVNYRVSLSSIDFNIKRSATGPKAYQWQYSLDGFATAGIDIGAQGSYTGDQTDGLAMLPPIDLSGVANLQNVVAGTTITLRLYAWGATGGAGSFSIGRLAGNDLVFMGQVIDNVAPTFTINDGTAAGPVQSDTINITANDSNLNAASLEYGFSTDNICNISDAYGNSFTNSTNFNIAGNHTDYLCVKASDTAGNIGYGLVGKLNTDNIAPTLSFIDNVATGSVFADTITGSWGDASVKKWDYDADGVCSTNIGDYSKTDVDSIDQTTETNNGKYICLYGEDVAGNKMTLISTHAINIDITPPTLNLPSNITAEATGPSGAIVTYSATADDTNPLHPTVTCSPTSGSTFSIATTPVNCSAADTVGNTAMGSFNITVHDATPPIIDSHSNITGEATSSAGAVVNYTAPNAVDLVDGIFVATCSSASGSTFSIGDTTVLCDATDSHGNHALQTNFKVTVRDTTAPAVIAPVDQDFEATGALTTPILISATATDSVDPNPAITYSPHSFSVGTTSVTWIATDIFGNESTITSKIIITDKIAPIITVPDDITIDTVDSSGKAVTYAVATAADVVDGSVLATCDKNSGDKFPVGITTVSCSAIDVATNIATKTFIVTVNLTQQQQNNGGGGGGGGIITFTISEESVHSTINEFTVTINWSTNDFSTSQVIYGAEDESHALDLNDNAGIPPKYGYANATIEFDTAPKVTYHTVSLTGLNPNKTYYYRTVSRGSFDVSNEYSFITPSTFVPILAQIPAPSGEITPLTPPAEQPVVEVVPGGTPVTNPGEVITETPGEVTTPNPTPSPQTPANPNPFAASLLSVASDYVWPIVIIFLILVVAYVIYLLIKRGKKQI